MEKVVGEGKTKGTVLVNDPKKPIQFGDITIKNRIWQPDKSRKPGEGILVKNVMTGFCGTDKELARMGSEGLLDDKFPPGENRLVNGHEMVVFDPAKKKYSVVLVRGGNAKDPTRYEEGETMFEYGCHKADGGMCYESYYNPEMLLDIPEKAFNKDGKVTETMAKRLVFADPYACGVFQRERMEDIAGGHNFRLFLREEGNEEKARLRAIKEIYKRVVVFGPGTTGFLIALEMYLSCKKLNIPVNILTIGRRGPDIPQVQYMSKYSEIKYMQNTHGKDLAALSAHVQKEIGGRATLFVAASGTLLESELAFKHKLLAPNAIYNSFSLGPTVAIDTMPFGFDNQLIYGAINYRRDHMEEAIEKLVDMPMDTLVNTYDVSAGLEKDPVAFYKDEAYARKQDTIKAAVIWDKSLLG